jgi:hypothetical protein
VASAGEAPLEVDEVALDAPPGWTVERTGAEADPALAMAPRAARFLVTVPLDARPTQPYWRRMADRDRHELVVAEDETRPWSPPPVVARVRVRIGGVVATLRAPASWRYEGPAVGGEKRHAVQVVPALSVRLSPEVAPIPLDAPPPLEVRVFVRSLAPHPGAGSVRLEAPVGWRVAPAEATLRFAYEGEEAAARFTLTPPPGLAAGTAVVRAVAARDGRESREGVQAIEYPHVERRPIVRPAEARLVALRVRTRPGASVGYVMGSGDGIADALRRLGVPVTLLSAEDLAFADLSRFRTILTGIRAYETREDLRSAHGRLMRWVERGGHLVVQYNRDAFNRVSPGSPPGDRGVASPYVPYPAAVTSERISDEEAPLRVLARHHPLLTAPNRIGEADWASWVQERGIQLLATRDPRYVELLASTDPFPNNPGEKRGLLVDATVGQGTWTYVGLALFRQVPAGVPGGWRLLANLVSRP